MKPAAPHSAFTLIELLVVISIVGLLVGVTLPTLKNFRGSDSTLAATRQLLDDVGRARQLAISQRTTVYMVFCPESFWTNKPYGPFDSETAFNKLSTDEKAKTERLYDKQLNAYTFVTLRSIGDQPGRSTVNYLAPWRSLPDGAMIAPWKFEYRTSPPTVITDPSDASRPPFNVYGFAVTNNIPFPSPDATVTGLPYVWLPYIAFNHLGQLESRVDEYIPLAKGSVQHGRDADKRPTQNPPSLVEQPPGNSTNAFSLIHIDWLTGRARFERQEFK